MVLPVLPSANSQIHTCNWLVLHWFIVALFSFLSFAPLILSTPCLLSLFCFLFSWFITWLSTLFFDTILFLDFSDCFPQIKVTGFVAWSREIVAEIHLDLNRCHCEYAWTYPGTLLVLNFASTFFLRFWRDNISRGLIFATSIRKYEKKGHFNFAIHFVLQPKSLNFLPLDKLEQAKRILIKKLTYKARGWNWKIWNWKSLQTNVRYFATEDTAKCNLPAKPVNMCICHYILILYILWLLHVNLFFL